MAAGNRRIGELKRKIAALGTPNLGAIDEYARVNERYTVSGRAAGRCAHLQAGAGEHHPGHHQGNDHDFCWRSSARSTTISARSSRRCSAAARVSWMLEDPENPLTCGIEIRVQPPGKQLKTITLLSGGEKAFVAIGAVLCHSEGPAHPLLPAGRDRRRPGRPQRRPVRRVSATHR